ncbi:MAG: hypothetical protein IIW02_00770 [Clostridia bacterium]|nr:hypothetical protein [Clostridia bacterium]
MYAGHSIGSEVAFGGSIDFCRVQSLVADSNASLVAAAKCTEELLALCQYIKSDKSVTTTMRWHDSAYPRSVKDFEAELSAYNIFSGPLPPDSVGKSCFRMKISKNEQRQLVSAVLYNLNLSSKDQGFYYLREVIVEIVNSQDFIPELTRTVMTKIGRAFNSSARTVERSLNKVMDEINNVNTRKYILKVVIGKELSSDSSYMNAKEFVALVADQIRLHYSGEFPFA